MPASIDPRALWLAAAVVGIGLGGWWSGWRLPSGWRGWLAAVAALVLLLLCGREAAIVAWETAWPAACWGGFASGLACVLAYVLCIRTGGLTEFDYAAMGMLAYAQAEALKEELRTVEAMKLMLVSHHLFKIALKNHDPGKDPFQFAMRSGDFAATLVDLGSWQNDSSLLGEAEGILRRALDCLDPQSDDERYLNAALCHNLGHALYRRGEIERNISVVRQGIAFLDNAIAVFRSPPKGTSWDKPLADTRKFRSKAFNVEQELDSQPPMRSTFEEL